MKSTIKKFVPPIVLDVRRLFSLSRSLYFFGDFPSWSEALKASHSLRLGSDYTSTAIIDKVEAATQAVRRGEALWDRDGVCFYEPDNNWVLLAALFYAKSVLNKISVLDLGGGVR